jgi:hypothetical protein
MYARLCILQAKQHQYPGPKYVVQWLSRHFSRFAGTVHWRIRHCRKCLRLQCFNAQHYCESNRKVLLLAQKLTETGWRPHQGLAELAIRAQR